MRSGKVENHKFVELHNPRDYMPRRRLNVLRDIEGLSCRRYDISSGDDQYELRSEVLAKTRHGDPASSLWGIDAELLKPASPIIDWGRLATIFRDLRPVIKIQTQMSGVWRGGSLLVNP
jgi:hypothetical protein